MNIQMNAETASQVDQQNEDRTMRADAIAQQVVGYRKRGEKISASTNRWLISSEEEAEFIQDKVAESMNEPIFGWKLGALDESGRLRNALSKPFVGRVFKSRSQKSPALLDKNVKPECIVESEIAFQLGKSLPAQNKSLSRAEVEDALVCVSAAYEIVDFSWPDRKGLRGLDIVADNGGCGGMVLGSVRREWRSFEMLDEQVELFVQGKSMVKSQVGRSTYDTVSAIHWFANHMQDRGISLEKGQWILTGTWTGMHSIEPGQSATAQYSSLGAITAILAEQ